MALVLLAGSDHLALGPVTMTQSHTLFLAMWWVSHLAASCMHHGKRERFDRTDRRDKGIFRLGRLWLLDILRRTSNQADAGSLLAFSQTSYWMALFPALLICVRERGLASGSWDGSVKLWDVESLCELQTLRGPTQKVYDVVWSPDGAT